MDNTAQPNLNIPGVQTNKWVKLLPKILLALAAVIILYELYLGVKTLTKPVPKAGDLKPLSGAKIALVSAKTSFKIGETIPITVRVTTGGHITSGMDVILKYDPKVLEATTSSFFRKGSIYPQYPSISLDNAGGSARASGIATAGKPGFNGADIFGTFILKAKSLGKTNVSLDFTKGVTNDSNVVEDRKFNDILDQVYDISIDITK